MKELAVEDHLIEESERLGGKCLKFLPYYALGFPDRMVLLPGGRVAFVELKRPTKEPTRAQWFWINKLRSLGFEAQWFSSHTAITQWINRFAVS